MSGMPRPKFCLLGLALLTMCGCQKVSNIIGGTTEDTQRKWGTPKTAAKITEDGLLESSGVAPSRLSEGWYFTHNDDEPGGHRFWKFDLKGNVIGPIQLRGTPNRDIEDMASAEIGGKPYLFFADIGDNMSVHKSIRISRCSEPKDGERSVVADAVYELTYEDGPRNAESFFVGPAGDFWVIQKVASKPAGVYRLANPKPGQRVLSRVGEIKIGGAIEGSRLATGAAVSPDGKYVIVRTYMGAYEFAVSGDFSSWWKSKPTQVPTNLDAQGEAITYALDGKSLITTSEGVPCQVSLIPLAGESK